MKEDWRPPPATWWARRNPRPYRDHLTGYFSTPICVRCRHESWGQDEAAPMGHRHAPNNARVLRTENDYTAASLRSDHQFSIKARRLLDKAIGSTGLCIAGI
jgi:hypothetical protein